MMSVEPYLPLPGIEIYHGDCRDVLARLEPVSVQCCVTSPPYWGLRDYGIPPSVWGGEKDCEHEWSSSGIVSIDNSDKRRWNHAVNGRGEEQPEEKKLLRKSGEVSQGQFCQRCNAWSGNLGLEPTPELFVEHIVEVFAAVWRVLKDDGTLWLNLGDSFCNSRGNGRGSKPERDTLAKGGKTPHRSAMDKTKCSGLKPKDLVGIPWACAFALRSAGWYLRSDIIWHKPNPMPESVTDRPTKSHEYIFLLSKSQRYFYDSEVVKEAMAAGSAERYEYAFGGSKSEALVEANKNGIGQRTRPVGERETDGKRNRRSVWSIATSPTPEAHFATFPPKLIEPCILAGCPEGGVVLDPFSGAGTTAMVCKNLGRRFIGAELNAEYIAIAEKRIGAQQNLF